METQASPTTTARNYPLLLHAIADVIRALHSEKDQQEVLRHSFEDAAQALGAQKALLLLVDESAPERLRSLWSRGLAPHQIAACERGQSLPGVSASTIRKAIATQAAILIENPVFQADIEKTGSLEGENYSVLCAPIVDPLRKTVHAVMYFQNTGVDYHAAYREPELAWLQSFAAAIGAAYSWYFDRAREPQEEAGMLPSDIIGISAHTVALRRLLHDHYIPAAAMTQPKPILITGETGTGKEHVARYIHQHSDRHRRPFVYVNCAELRPLDIVPSRLFGYVRGAFTGADRDTDGFFQAAQAGVLLIDEIGELPLEAQGALLSAIDKHQISRMGDHRRIPTDIYVILATNRDLQKATQAGDFKFDLYQRFKVHTVRLTPLRERPSDIHPLLDHYLGIYRVKTGKRTTGLTDEALRALISYAWPGNVRELDHVCEALMVRVASGARIDRKLVELVYPDAVHGPQNPTALPLLWTEGTMNQVLHASRKELLIARLLQHGGGVRRACQSLGMSKSNFHRYLAAYGLTQQDLGGTGTLLLDEEGDEP